MTEVQLKQSLSATGYVNFSFHLQHGPVYTTGMVTFLLIFNKIINYENMKYKVGFLQAQFPELTLYKRKIRLVQGEIEKNV